MMDALSGAFGVDLSRFEAEPGYRTEAMRRLEPLAREAWAQRFAGQAPDFEADARAVGLFALAFADDERLYTRFASAFSERHAPHPGCATALALHTFLEANRQRRLAARRGELERVVRREGLDRAWVERLAKELRPAGDRRELLIAEGDRGLVVLVRTLLEGEENSALNFIAPGEVKFDHAGLWGRLTESGSWEYPHGHEEGPGRPLEGDWRTLIEDRLQRLFSNT